jgi:hypothetical protein
MEPLFQLVSEWWWGGPALVALGAAAYSRLTLGRRRARRLEVDAARHEVTAAQAAVISARAQTRAAQARMFAAQADRKTRVPAFLSVPVEHRELQSAKQAQRSAVMALRAKRIEVTAARARMHAMPHRAAQDGLPLAQLVREHDAITAQWLEYETDPLKGIAFPQMTDARHPRTAAYLLAQREAMRLRPSSASTRFTPQQYVAYRDAIRALDAAFAIAEEDALRRAWAPPAAPAPAASGPVARPEPGASGPVATPAPAASGPVATPAPAASGPVATPAPAASGPVATPAAAPPPTAQRIPPAPA